MLESLPTNEPMEVSLNKEQLKSMADMTGAICSSINNATEKAGSVTQRIDAVVDTLERTSYENNTHSVDLRHEITSLTGSTNNLNESTNQLTGQIKELSEAIYGLRLSINELINYR